MYTCVIFSVWYIVECCCVNTIFNVLNNEFTIFNRTVLPIYFLYSFSKDYIISFGILRCCKGNSYPSECQTPMFFYALLHTLHSIPPTKVRVLHRAWPVHCKHTRNQGVFFPHYCPCLDKTGAQYLC